MREQWRNWIILGLLLCVGCGVRFWFIEHKECIHINEEMTFIIADYTDYAWEKNFKDGTTFKGSYFREDFFFPRDDAKDMWRDIYRMRMENRDSPHTNLYYSIYRVWVQLFGSGNLDWLIKSSCYLNIILYVLSFFILNSIARRLFPEADALRYGLLFMAFMNAAAISNTMFIREYQLQETLFLVLTALFIRYYDQLQEGGGNATCRNLVTGSLLLGLVLLSGYFSILYVALFGAVLLGMALWRRQYEDCGFFCALVVFACIVACALYTQYFDGLLDYRGKEALDKLGATGFWANVWETLLGGGTMFVSKGVPAFVLGIAGGSLLLSAWRKEKLASLPLLIGALTLCYLIAAFYFAPVKRLRYMMSAIPVLYIGVVACLPYGRQGKILCAIMACVVAGSVWNNVDYVKIDEPNIECLSKKNVVIANETPWKLGVVLQYAQPESTYTFRLNCDKVAEDMAGKEDSILLVEDNIVEQCKRQLDASFQPAGKYSCYYLFTR